MASAVPTCRRQGLFRYEHRSRGVLGWLVLFGIGLLIWLTWVSQRASRFDGIELRGTRNFTDHVVSALTLLRTKAPEAYGIVTNCIKVIVQSAHTGMAAYANPPTSHLHDKVEWESLQGFASGIAHESFHSKLYLDRQRELGASAVVPDDAWTGETAEMLCCQHQARVLRRIGGSEAEISYYDWDPTRDPTNRYWEVPYEKRNW